MVRLVDARPSTRVLLRAQSDARLVTLASAGHEAAFEAIVDRYAGPLRAFCRRLVPDGREEDVVQQAFLNVHRSLAAGRADVELRPWLYAVARNAAFDALREGGGRGHEPLDGVERSSATTEETVLARARLADTVAGVRALPSRQREALVLQELEGLTQQQVAELLGLTEGGVRQLVHRARETLRRGVAGILPLPLVERLLGSASAHAAGAGGTAAGGGGVFAGGALALAGKAAVTVAVAGAGIGLAKAPMPEASPVDERRGGAERRVVAASTDVAESDLLAMVRVARGRGDRFTARRDTDRVRPRAFGAMQRAAAPGAREDANRAPSAAPRTQSPDTPRAAAPASGTHTDAHGADSQLPRPAPGSEEHDAGRPQAEGPETAEPEAGDDPPEDAADDADEAVERHEDDRHDDVAPEGRDDADDEVPAPAPADADGDGPDDE